MVIDMQDNFYTFSDLLNWLSISLKIDEGYILFGMIAFILVISILLITKLIKFIILLNKKRHYKKQDNEQRIVQKISRHTNKLGEEELKGLLVKIYNKQGYRILEDKRSNVEGCIYLCLEKNRLLHLVWFLPYELLLVKSSFETMYKEFMEEENAIKMTLITSEDFSENAKIFATQNDAIELMDGKSFAMMVDKSKIKLSSLN